MIEETGTVTKTDGLTATVLVQRKSECEACTAARICEPSQGGMEIEALNPVNAKAGQRVKIAMKPQAYLKGSIIVYGIPLTAFIAGVILGKNIGETHFKEFSSDTTAAIFGFISLIITFIIIKIWSKKAEKRLDYKPVIEKIVNSE
ncbi:MAG: SoxR reducing system RseC family protein [Nitrospirae bacterium]|nr:SoxR reducing system RseC family protein [Nitrospirota bacterium]